jgi:hypothetical protein
MFRFVSIRLVYETDSHSTYAWDLIMRKNRRNGKGRDIPQADRRHNPPLALALLGHPTTHPISLSRTR